MISSQSPDTKKMYLLVTYPEARPGNPVILGPYNLACERTMAAVSIHHGDHIECSAFMMNIKRDDTAEIVPYPRKFFDQLHARKSLFCIEDGTQIEGYTDGCTWNGWAMPYFTKENAIEVLKEYPGNESDDEDAYRNYSFPPEDSFYIINPDTGTPIEVWGIGSGAWCWEEIAEGE